MSTLLHEHNNPGPSLRPVVLTIAGSDSGGGAGIQADLKTFMALGVHGVSAITALTAQNTRGVGAIHRPPLTFLRAQLDALFDDFPIAAVKIGMLGSAAVVRTVAAVLTRRQARRIVLDPVLVASSGDRLGDQRTLAAIRDLLLPLADVLTPNLPEAEALLGRPLDSLAAMAAAADDLAGQVRGCVLLKGGHLQADPLVDLLACRGGQPRRWQHERLPIEGHGTGCTLSAAIAAGLGHGVETEAAVAAAIAFLQRGLAAAYQPGRGSVRVLDVLAAASR